MSNKSQINNYINEILSYNKNTIIFYLCIGTFLFYIWYLSNISINYLFPFILLLLIFVIKQNNVYNTRMNSNNKLETILKTIINNNYIYIPHTTDILNFLNDISIYKKYNSDNFTDLLEQLNKYYKYNTLDHLLITLEIFNRFIYSLPIEKTYNLNIQAQNLKNILYKTLKKNKYNRVEMQSYIPNNFYNNNNNNNNNNFDI